MSITNDIHWRSLLYVPANNQKFIKKAHTRGADAIILDLEDSVPHQERPKARAMLADSIKSVTQSGADAVVRINRPLRDMVQDVEAAVKAGARALMVTKVMSADHVRLVAELVEDVEREAGRAAGTVRLIPMIEGPDAYFQARDIAGAHARNVALVMGGEDFAMEVGMVPDGETFLLPKQTIMLAAKAAGLLALGFIGTVADFSDTTAFRETVKRSRKFGFDGASVIHPSGIAVLNEEMVPTTDEVDHAERVVAAYKQAQRDGIGAITLDGKMIDVPVVIRAEKLLAIHERFQNR